MRNLFVLLLMGLASFSAAKELEKIYPLKYQDYRKAKFEVDHEPSQNGMEGLWAKGESDRGVKEQFNRFKHPVNGRLNLTSGVLRLSKGRFFFKTTKQSYHFDDSYSKKMLLKHLKSLGVDLSPSSSLEVKLLAYWTYSRYSRKYQIAYLEKVERN